MTEAVTDGWTVSAPAVALRLICPLSSASGAFSLRNPERISFFSPSSASLLTRFISLTGTKQSPSISMESSRKAKSVSPVFSICFLTASSVRGLLSACPAEIPEAEDMALAGRSPSVHTVTFKGDPAFTLTLPPTGILSGPRSVYLPERVSVRCFALTRMMTVSFRAAVPAWRAVNDFPARTSSFIRYSLPPIIRESPS